MKICPTCRHTHADEITFCPHDGTRLQADAALPAGRLIDGRYEVETLIAETRNGLLYRARDSRHDRRVALKIFRPELRREVAKWLQRFQREAHAAPLFRHPNAVTIYDLRADYIVMEYVEGQTLDKELRQRGRFTPGEVVSMLEPVARALDAARADGITCDFLTPADIMIGRAENNFLPVKLLPLIFNRRAFAQKLGVLSTGGFNTQVAAAPYVAPKLRGDAMRPTEESDPVYSLGVISYELVAGQKPYDGLTPVEIAQKQLAGQLTPLSELAPDIPSPVARVIERTLAKKAKNRPATAGEFVSEFQDALGLNQVKLDARLAESTGGTRATPAASRSATESAPAATGMRSAKNHSGLVGKPKSRDASVPLVDAPVADKPLYTDENVQFTVYQPETVAPARWHTLLAFAHLSKRRPDAPPDEPEPLAEVKRLAARVLADQPTEYDAVKQNSLHAVPQKGEITFVPEIAGCEFNPSHQSFSWEKSVHKVEFEMRAGVSLDGRMARGRLTVFLGSLILADVPLAIRVDSVSGSSAREVPSVPASAAPYRKIFPSYSHKDRAVVEQIEQHAHALGDKYLRDLTELRAGQDWQRWMRDAIREADVFQLFWSHNSMRSAYVRQEWEYALSLGRQNFVRPTYWEQPLPESPAENLPPAELRQLHFQHLGASASTSHPTPTATDNAPAQPERRLPTDRQMRGSAPADAQSAGDVVCVSCGLSNPVEKAFCQYCGGTLRAAPQSSAQQEVAQSPHQPATIPTQEVEAALDVFWAKRKREATGSRMPASPLRPQPQSQSPRGTSGRPLLWFSLLFLIALALGAYLLIRLL